MNPVITALSVLPISANTTLFRDGDVFCALQLTACCLQNRPRRLQKCRFTIDSELTALANFLATATSDASRVPRDLGVCLLQTPPCTSALRATLRSGMYTLLTAPTSVRCASLFFSFPQYRSERKWFFRNVFCSRWGWEGRLCEERNSDKRCLFVFFGLLGCWEKFTKIRLAMLECARLIIHWRDTSRC